MFIPWFRSLMCSLWLGGFLLLGFFAQGTVSASATTPASRPTSRKAQPRRMQPRPRIKPATPRRAAAVRKAVTPRPPTLFPSTDTLFGRTPPRRAATRRQPAPRPTIAPKVRTAPQTRPNQRRSIVVQPFKIPSQPRFQTTAPLPPRKKPEDLPTSTLLNRLQTTNWDLQRKWLGIVVKRGKSTIPALKALLSNPKAVYRARILAVIGLAQLKDKSGIPWLLEQAIRLYDQPLALIDGGFLQYGQAIVPALIQALPRTRFPHHLIRLAGQLKAKQALPHITPFLTHRSKKLRQLAREATQNMGAVPAALAFAQALKQSKDANVRAALIRPLGYLPAIEATQALVDATHDKNDAVRYLARRFLRDHIEMVEAKTPKALGKAPKGDTAKSRQQWQRWWAKHKQVFARYFQQRTSQPLQMLPKLLRWKTLVLYRTVHPVFSVGRMPLLIHDRRWAKPPSPIRGRVWRVALPSKEFAALLKSMEQRRFFSWPQKLGHLRDITIYARGRKRRVQIGMSRFLPFEALEQKFRQWAKKAKLGLNFQDYYNRLDETILTARGVIGQWSYRAYDRLPEAKWSTPSTWKPRADLESSMATLRSIIRHLPGRTRLISFDMDKEKIKLTGLLFGSRAQSRYTMDGLRKARRLRDLKATSIGVIYLAHDKIERLIVHAKRLVIPNGVNHDRQAPHLSALQALQQSIPFAEIQTQNLQYTRRGKLHRFDMIFKAASPHAVLRLLSELAARSRGDKVLALRINHSGEADRDEYSLIVQLRWEMLTPLEAASKRPYFLKLSKPHAFNIFTPIYR